MKITAHFAISLNGFVATKNGSEEFLSDENWKDLVRKTKNVDCLIWGRNTYEQVKKWDKKYIRSLGNVKVIVLSKNSKQYINSPIDAIKFMRKEGYNNAIISGPTITRAFLKSGLVDEIIMNIDPILIEDGISLKFDKIARLKLINVSKIRKNIVQLHYKILK
jgi:dihydrofolate reductase